MKSIKFINAFLFFAVMGVIVASLLGANPWAAAAVVTVLGFVAAGKEKGILAVGGIETEVWVQDVVERLFPNDSFIMNCVNHSAFVREGKYVHVPKAGTNSATVKNRAVFPASIVTRGDSDLYYPLDSYTSDPVKIRNLDQIQRSYDLRNSVMGSEQRNLVSNIHKGVLYNWAPAAANVKRTSGGNTDPNISGGTGQRKKLVKADLKQLQVLMDAENIPEENRFVLLNAWHYADLMDSFDTNETSNFNNVADLKKGVVGEYMGFKVMKRSTVLRYRGADGSETAVDELDSAFAAGADDRKGSLVWQADCVAAAKGNVDFFDNLRDPQHYGDIFSYEAIMGGRILRTEGVWAIVDAIV